MALHLDPQQLCGEVVAVVDIFNRINAGFVLAKWEGKTAWHMHFRDAPVLTRIVQGLQHYFESGRLGCKWLELHDSGQREVGSDAMPAVI